jgi:hypothetical protein
MAVSNKTVVVWAVTQHSFVSEKHVASIFQAEKCRFRKRLGYIHKLQGRLSWDPKRVKEPGSNQWKWKK